MVDKHCKACGTTLYVEEHHIVFRSKAPYMINIKLNLKNLCYLCHRGNDGPHSNNKTDRKYKFELQTKLFKVFTKSYYSEDEIRDLLETNDIEVRKIVKVLKKNSEGYERLALIRRVMGDELYVKSWFNSNAGYTYFKDFRGNCEWGLFQ